MAAPEPGHDDRIEETGSRDCSPTVATATRGQPCLNVELLHHSGDWTQARTVADMRKGVRILQLITPYLERLDLAMSTKVLARVMRALPNGDRHTVTNSPGGVSVKTAQHLQLLAFSGSAHTTLREGKFLSLGAKEYRGAVFMRNRVGQVDLARLLGMF